MNRRRYLALMEPVSFFAEERSRKDKGESRTRAPNKKYLERTDEVNSSKKKSRQLIIGFLWIIYLCYLSDLIDSAAYVLAGSSARVLLKYSLALTLSLLA